MQAEAGPNDRLGIGAKDKAPQRQGAPGQALSGAVACPVDQHDALESERSSARLRTATRADSRLAAACGPDWNCAACFVNTAPRCPVAIYPRKGMQLATTISHHNYGAGGEACGYRVPERAVFKHPNKMPQY
jgi:hypothetical protein